MAAWLHTSRHLCKIRGTRIVLHEKMEDGTIVPKVHTRIGEQWRGDITNYPIDVRSSRPEALSSETKRRISEIDHGQIAIALGHQIVYQRGRTPTNIHDSSIERESRRTNKCQRAFEVWPIPTHLVGRPAFVYRLPMVLAIHGVCPIRSLTAETRLLATALRREAQA